MHSPRSGSTTIDFRRAALVTAAQLALMLAAVLVSRLGLGVRTTLIAVMGVTAVNGGVIALRLLGVRRERLIAMLAIVTAVFIIGLLAWPAWDVYERMGY
jgi:hypothetical protein